MHLGGVPDEDAAVGFDSHEVRASHRAPQPGGLPGNKGLREAPSWSHPRCPTLPDSPHLLMVDLCSKMLPDLVLYVTLLS